MVALIAFWAFPFATLAQVCSVDQTRLPADIPVPNDEATAATFQQFGWDSFLALNAAEVGGPPADAVTQDPLWRSWSSAVDMLSCQGSPTPAGCDCEGDDCSQPGARFYPTACRAVPGYENYRVLQQRGPLDDLFLEAEVGELSNSPVLDRFGNFLKYEILMSPATYANVTSSGLWDQEVLQETSADLVFNCGNSAYTGGDPAHPDMGDIVLKLAWMQADGEAGAGLDLDAYYTEDLLVYTPAYRASDGVERCTLRTMALGGMHIAHKTLRQPNWVWATFEHRDIAPNCTDAMTNPGDTETNMSCPTAVEQEFGLYGSRCNDGDPACAPCNVTPASNDPGDLCRNPTTPELEGWCLDQPPAAESGTSKLCRHVAVEPPEIENVPAPIPAAENYPEAAALNQACANALVQGGHAPWSHYMMISSQWLRADVLPPETEPLTCDTVADDIFFGIVNAQAIEPKVATRGGAMRPFLGNITMESYGKSNCIGCHSRARVENSEGDAFNSDFMYFLSLNVAAHDTNFMTWDSAEPTSTCQAPGDPAIVEFDLTAGAANALVAEQAIEMLVGLEFPEDLPDPVISPRDAMDPSMPWVQGENEIMLEPDESCTAGMCQVDTIFPPRPGQRWRQYRSDPAVSIGPETPDLATRLVVEFENLTCEDIDPLDLRIWVSDNSQTAFANQVDGDYLDLTMFLLPEPPPEEIEYHAVPALNRFAILALVLTILGVGIWESRRR